MFIKQHFQSLDKLNPKLVWPEKNEQSKMWISIIKNLAVMWSALGYYKIIIKKEGWKPPLFELK